jgi:cytochrome c oxidase subunit I
MMDFYPTIPQDHRLRLIRGWFILAISALGLSGIFSLAPAVLRGPFFQQYFDTQHIFDVALVLHVNLSVLVWILTLACMFWSFSLARSLYGLGYTLFILAAIGTSLMVISPFIGTTIAVKSNYIPVLLNISFSIGLALLLCSVLGNSILYLRQRVISYPTTFGLYIAAIPTILAALCFIVAGTLLEDEHGLGPEEFYNLLFWGGGHVLQFTYTNLLLVAWLWLASIGGIQLRIGVRTILVILAFNLIVVLPTPLFFLLDEDITNSLYPFTLHMQIFAGIAPTLIGILLLYSWKHRTSNSLTCPPYIYPTLFFSIAFFAYGGILGLFIRQMNTIVPAHYHASVVGGLTIALMGLCYYFLPLFGYLPLKGRLPIIQTYLYSIGHLLHITGLAVMGGYGALRKTASDTGQIDTLIGKLMFFAGSPLALLGGLLFIVIVIRSIILKNLIQKQ